MRSIKALITATWLVVTLGTAVAAQAPAAFDEDGHLPLGSLVGAETAVVVEVVDGDTIVVERGDGLATVRYIGIDAPSVAGSGAPAEPFADEATAANAELVGDRTVILEVDISDVDREGRLLRYVWLETDDGLLFVNDELVRRGFAEVVADAPNTRNYAYLSGTQAEAMAAELGIWGDAPAPTPAPDRGSLDTSVRTFDPDFRYRWLAGSEYRCRQANGCWGLVVLPDVACPGRLEVEVVIQDVEGERLEVVTKQRAAVARGAEERFKVVPAGAGAHLAYVADIRCVRSP